MSISWARVAAHFCVLSVSGWTMLRADDQPPKKEDAPQAGEESERAFKFTAAADALYSWNANHPQSGLNQLHNFDMNADAWSLVSASFGVEREGERFNFRFDSGYGEMNKAMAVGDAWHGPNQYILQAYVGFKPFEGREFKVEAGKFATPTGGELPETFNNFNTTRSLLYVLGIPYYHFGMRATTPVSSEWTAGVYVVNGWNNVVENNWGTTFGATAHWKGKSQTLNAAYFGGSENPATNQSSHSLVDLVYGFTAKKWWNNYTEFVWGGQGRMLGIAAPVSNAPVRYISYGFAHASRFNISRNLSLSPRVSWFMDRDGAATGMPQRLMEMTGTFEYRVSKWMLARAEMRRDLSNRDFFDAGSHPSSSKTQDTALLGLTFLWKAER